MNKTSTRSLQHFPAPGRHCYTLSDIISLLELRGLIVVKSIDICLGELSCRRFLCEQDVQLLERAVFGLGEAEEGPNEEAKGCTTPEKGCNY